MKRYGRHFKQMSIGLAMVCLILAFSTLPAHAQVVFSENFEAGWGNWAANNGVWEVGSSSIVECSLSGGSNCAGTILNGNYPPDTDSRFYYTQGIQLPSVSGGEELLLRFWQTFSYAGGDSGQVQISVWDGISAWLPWENVGNVIVNTSGVWSLMGADLTPYAGERVRIGFLHTAVPLYEGTGWYIDDIQIIKKVPYLAQVEDFESGWGDWYADRGVWEVGTPVSVTCHSGTKCAGKVLDGNYPPDTDSRLISPTVQLLPAVAPSLRFWHTFAYAGGDFGQVQISVWDDVSGIWSTWSNIGGSISGTSPVWSLAFIDLTAYAGKKVRIGFLHTAIPLYEGTGWYIDDVEITGRNRPPVIDSFTAVPTSGNPPLPVSFTCVAHDPDGTIAEYRWDFNGDGIIDQVTSTGSTDHTYTACGTYAATCTAVDNLGAPKTSDPVTISICVGPKPDIKANGSDGPITIKPADTLSVTISLDSGNGVGMNADWWIVAETSGGWYHLDLMCDCWKPSLFVTYLSPLYNLSPLEVLNMSGLPVGAYKFYFAVDMNMNGHLDMGQLYYDSVTVTVSTP